MHRLVAGKLIQRAPYPLTLEIGGLIGAYWLVEEVEDGPPIGFGAPSYMTVIFGGLGAEERAKDYYTQLQED